MMPVKRVMRIERDHGCCHLIISLLAHFNLCVYMCVCRCVQVYLGACDHWVEMHAKDNFVDLFSGFGGKHLYFLSHIFPLTYAIVLNTLQHLFRL